MRLRKFVDSWFEDWTTLMSGIVSVGLLFWVTLWPPSQSQLKPALLIISACCFVLGSYRIWSKSEQRYQDLTGKTRMESLNDLISDFQKLEGWYGDDKSTTTPKPLDLLIKRTLEELRYHSPDAVHVFKRIAADPTAKTESPFPIRNRTILELGNWRSNEEREKCWRTVSACLYQLKIIRRDPQYGAQLI
jgi:hypothetical protein